MRGIHLKVRAITLLTLILLALSAHVSSAASIAPLAPQPYSWQSPQALLATTQQAQSYIYLLKWNDSFQNPPPPTIPYKREAHFGGWISIKDDRSCLDVRNRVLIRDSLKQVELKPDKPCKVQRGYWLDPYLNRVFTEIDDVDIDHFVPLKNAYNNGAWKWNNQQRCLYANYMGFTDHLKVVNSRENSLKNYKDPSEYMPPNRAYRCEYLKRWLSIKLIWRLSLRVEEAQAIRYWVQKENCDTRQFMFSADELRVQRQKIMSLLPICAFKNPATTIQ